MTLTPFTKHQIQLAEQTIQKEKKGLPTLICELILRIVELQNEVKRLTEEVNSK